MATCLARPGERPRDTYSWVSSSSSASGAVSSWTCSLASCAACWSRSARSLEYSTAPMASVPATSPGEPGEYEHARAGESLADPGRGQNSVARFGYMRTHPLDDLSGGDLNHQLALEFIVNSSDLTGQLWFSLYSFG